MVSLATWPFLYELVDLFPAAKIEIFDAELRAIG